MPWQIMMKREQDSFLFVHFDPHMTAHVAPVLQDLRHWHLVQSDSSSVPADGWCTSKSFRHDTSEGRLK